MKTHEVINSIFIKKKRKVMKQREWREGRRKEGSDWSNILLPHSSPSPGE